MFSNLGILIHPPLGPGPRRRERSSWPRARRRRAAREAAIAGNDICVQMSFEPESDDEQGEHGAGDDDASDDDRRGAGGGDDDGATAAADGEAAGRG